jgi:hypothetical protein
LVYFVHIQMTRKLSVSLLRFSLRHFLREDHFYGVEAADGLVD